MEEQRKKEAYEEEEKKRKAEEDEAKKRKADEDLNAGNPKKMPTTPELVFRNARTNEEVRSPAVAVTPTNRLKSSVFRFSEFVKNKTCCSNLEFWCRVFAPPKFEGFTDPEWCIVAFNVWDRVHRKPY